MNRMLVPGGLVALLAASANADIVGVGGSVSHVPAPASAQVDAFTSPFIHAWNERQGVMLDAPLAVNATTPGVYNSIASLTPGEIPVEAIVGSHYIHLDTPGTEEAILSGWVTFSAPILGVIVSGDAPGWNFLDASDFLGTGTIYPDGVKHRGLEMPVGIDTFSISADRLTLFIDQFRVVNPGDHVRVITETLPTPGTITLAGLAGLLAMKRRRA